MYDLICISDTGLSSRKAENRRPYCGKQQQVVLHALYYQGCLLKAAEKGNSARSTESSAKTLQPLASVQNTVCPVLTIPGVLPRNLSTTIEEEQTLDVQSFISIFCLLKTLVN
ncbi:hypothetical protein T4B_14139 [Trichinella pseudospiralis]|uniref:Uncharacterized protein n=1 Tax=Trichinella pseudospiralis TaxID=6337 RepID=A0A0V1JR91_TRIPS|nr:hypothetical protein T4B_14139 [Trichinella pseudospiralis]KRZ37502.1 hypothetical protein T4C_2884 [Trichinella pseudospiralis]